MAGALDRDDRKLLILYGSQTGYAEDTARRIARQAWRRHFAVQVQAMDRTDRTAFFACDRPLVVFVCSTTGQGDEPDNMKKFWRVLLRKTIPHDALVGMRYAVFGLGDSSYQRFNFAAKRLHRRLAQLGATPVVERGDGDDQHYLGLDGALDPWLRDLWEALLHDFPLPRPIVPESVAPAASVDVSFDSSASLDPVDRPPVFPGTVAATLTQSERITAPDHFQDVRHLRFQIDGTLKWNPGDCAVLRPSNMAPDVDAFLAAAHWTDTADTPLHITPLSNTVLASWVPRTTTLRWLCTYYFDIGGIPKRSFFEMLFYFSQNPDERDRLHEFSSTAGQDDLHAYCMRPRRTVAEALADFPGSPIPVAYAFDVLPAIAERSFSISSDSLHTPAAVDLTVAVVEYKTMMHVMRRGVCTKWLAHMSTGTRVQLRIARGLMRLPPDSDTPLIMVGPGTGIAAFMAFIQHRRHVDPQSANYLFFGCRSEHKDFYYRTQLEQWCSEGCLHLFCAFSRDSADGSKVYVQDRIRDNGSLVWSLLSEQQASVYVSGNANRMPQDVRAAFVDVVTRHGDGLSADDAGEYIRAMEKSGRYQEECWY
ncbi:NAPDH-dependent diflavin reductase [Coemansia sp. RSA 1813]|nr:NAPDH-dependent diflavin reductase [Coemansia sp. RSA 1646]KAJ1766868.1 NAPDH-dependent diflavin reductase [Coemansia sp. RSA 1843]KAJ2217189.1 NAPDH-dependent diflavin reductase [Coemansia sp. RSA 487]KAJ2572386.1 NAPDH-dependent diflavin reductase [Coemansia sp. RSA 1813]